MANFDLSVESLDLTLRHTFTISRGSRDQARNLLVKVRKDGIEGFGEAAPNTRYKETPESAASFLSSINLNHLQNPYDLAALHHLLDDMTNGEYAAKAAVEMALGDWIGKKLDLPLYRLWNAPARIGPRSSVTIGISAPEEIRKRVEESADFKVLKVKLGGENDREAITLIRQLTNKTIWVDANEGWESYDEAISMIELLHKLKVEFVEQPMPADRVSDLKKLKRNAPLPIIADEGYTGNEQFEEIADIYDGINIKLMKIGGMTRALKAIARARMANLKIMIGCMVETSLANTAAAIVAQWADFADIDGPFLIADDPFNGFTLNKDSRIMLNDSPGLGVKRIR